MRVNLRLVRKSDIEPVYRLLSDANVIRYMLFELHSREEAESERAHAPLDEEEIPGRYVFMEDALGNTEVVAEECSFEPALGAPILPRTSSSTASSTTRSARRSA